jgi:hypothetical protein
VHAALEMNFNRTMSISFFFCISVPCRDQHKLSLDWCMMSWFERGGDIIARNQGDSRSTNLYCECNMVNVCACGCVAAEIDWLHYWQAQIWKKKASRRLVFTPKVTCMRYYGKGYNFQRTLLLVLCVSVMPPIYFVFVYLLFVFVGSDIVGRRNHENVALIGRRTQ